MPRRSEMAGRTEMAGGSPSDGGASFCPDLLYQGTKRKLCEEIARRGVMNAKCAASCNKPVLQRMLRMSMELEEKEQELALAQKRCDAASLSILASAAAAEEDEVSPSSASRLSVMCSACLNFAAFRAPARSPRPQACTAARRQKRTVGAVLGWCVTSACWEAAGRTRKMRLTWTMRMSQMDNYAFVVFLLGTSSYPGYLEKTFRFPNRCCSLLLSPSIARHPSTSTSWLLCTA